MTYHSRRSGTALATLVVAAAGLAAVPAQAQVHPWNVHHGAGRSWFKDPLSKAQRRAEITIPAGPQRFNGTAKKATVVTLRTHAGKLAVPASMAYGHQLVKGQALTFNGGSLFKVSSATLTAHARRVVTRLAYSMSDVAAVTCEGYADFGHHGLHANKRLSTRRARSLCTALAGQTDLTTKAHGYGSSRPAVIGSTNPYRNANRRVVLLIRANVAAPLTAPVITNGTTPTGHGQGNFQFTMTWTTPTSDGGSPITGYEWSTNYQDWTAFGSYTTSGTDNTGTFDSGINSCSTGSIPVVIRAVTAPALSDPSNQFQITYDTSC